MNEGVLVLAILYKKGLISKMEATALRDMLKREVVSDNLAEMEFKVEKAFKGINKPKIAQVEEINATDLIISQKSVA